MNTIEIDTRNLTYADALAEVRRLLSEWEAQEEQRVEFVAKHGPSGAEGLGLGSYSLGQRDALRDAVDTLERVAAERGL